MSIGEYIGIGATTAIAGGWIIVLVKEFVAPWLKHKMSHITTTAASRN